MQQGIQVKVFWVVMCSVVAGYLCFRGPCCLHLHHHENLKSCNKEA